MIPDGPIDGPEQPLIHDLPQDNLVAGLVTLASEVYMLRDRIKVLESELARNNLLPADAVDAHIETDSESSERKRDAEAFAARFWSSLARRDQPPSKVDSRVRGKYLSKEPSP